MNLLATLSTDQVKPLGDMEWYGTVIPLVSLLMTGANITPLMTCGELLALILNLPADVRSHVLAVTVPDTAANENAVQEIKQETHRGMMVGISGIFLIIAFISLFMFIGYTEIKGDGANSETVGMLWSIIKEIAEILSSGQ